MKLKLSEPTDIKTIYVCGPMRGYPNHNFDAFDTSERLGISLGYNVISPAAMDRLDCDETKCLSDVEKQRMYAKRDLDAIFNSDAIAVLPGFQKSIGAMAEFSLARWLCLPILDARTFEPLDKKYYPH